MGSRSSKVTEDQRLKNLPYDIRMIIAQYAIIHYVSHVWSLTQAYGSECGYATGFLCLYDDGVYQFSGDYSEGTLWLIFKESGTYVMDILPSGQQVVHITTDFMMNNSHKRTQACSPHSREFTLTFPEQVGPNFQFAGCNFTYTTWIPAKPADLVAAPSRFPPLYKVEAPKDEIVCFNGDALISLDDGSRTPALSLEPGMRVRCRIVGRREGLGSETFLKNDISVAVVTKKVVSQTLSPPLVQLGTSLWITRCHPVFFEGRWVHPEEIGTVCTADVHTLVSFELSEHHNVLAEDEWVACLGADVGARLIARRPDLDARFGTGYKCIDS